MEHTHNSRKEPSNDFGEAARRIWLPASGAPSKFNRTLCSIKRDSYLESESLFWLPNRQIDERRGGGEYAPISR